MAPVRKRTVFLLPAAALLIFAAWMLWPRSLGADPEIRGNVSALIITSGVENSQPYQDLEEYSLDADSPEAEALREILNRYSYHLCPDSLTAEDSISGIGSLSVTLYDPQDAEREFDVYSGTGKIWLNGRIVRLDYFGNGRAEALSRELANLLRGESGVAN